METLKFKQNQHPEKSFRIVDKILEPQKWSVLEMNSSSANDFYEVYVDELVKEIKNAEKFIYIVSGELCSRVWNDKNIVKSLSMSKVKNIKIVCGPEIDIKSVDIIKLIADGKIKIYYSKNRETNHFIITDKAVFVEDNHIEFGEVKKIMVRRMSRTIIFLYKNIFKRMILFKKEVEPEKENILEKFNPKVYYPDSKDNSKEATPNEKENFISVLQPQH